ncbi:MAG: hypothetical protein KDB53_03260 [Planctomycetes bacterium]|nr:hypothetical protein [Planctomycetota bacterium]
MRLPKFILLVLACCPSLATAQGFMHSDLTTIWASSLPQIDDIVRLPDGRIVASFPTLQQLAVVDPLATPQITNLGTPPVVCVGMIVGPDGALYYGNANTGDILRYDPVAGTTSTFATGFNIPVDLAFDGPSTLWVANLTTADFFGGITNLHRLDITLGVVTNNTLVHPNIPGAADVAIGPAGFLYVGSLGAVQIGKIDPVTGAVTTLGSGIVLASDLEFDARGRLLVSTLFENRVWELDPVTQSQVEVTSFLTTGTHAEDLAQLLNGDLLVSLGNGAIVLIDRSSALHQVGEAHVGGTFRLRTNLPGSAGEIYSLAAAASSLVGIPVPGTSMVFPLDPDLVFSLSTSNPRPPNLLGFDGLVDTQGRAEAIVQVLNFPGFVGVSFWFAGVTYASVFVPLTAWTVTNPVRVEVVP